MSDNYIDATGLVTQTLTEIVVQLEEGFKAIYGADINVDANSPDGQMINLFAQAKIDILDCMTEIYNSFSPSQAIGVTLDQRCALNGVVRQGATNTVIQAVVTTDRIVNLTGINTGGPNVFVIADAQGNKFNLIDDQTTGIGANTYLFQAAVAGAVNAVPNTVNQIVTITLGVLSVNNPNDPISQGINEETDTQLRVRRQQSVALPSQGFAEGLTAGILSITNVIGCKVYENTGSTTDIYGTPGHSIWCVVDGGDNDLIADVIYNKRNAGCGMRGTVIVPKALPNGFNIPIKFDRPTLIDLYIELEITSIDPTHLIDDNYIKTQIFEKVIYNIYEPADYTEITTIVKEIDSLAVVLSGGVSIDNITFSPFIYPATLAGRFIISTARINIIVV
jgi:uncharacterized phage protein gp47/JayE